jgi:ribonuclease Z
LATGVAVQRIIASYHTTPKDAGMVFVQAKPKLAVYTLFVLLSNATIPPPTLDEVIAETRQTYSGPLEAGEDLTSFEIGDTVTVHHFKP